LVLALYVYYRCWQSADVSVGYFTIYLYHCLFWQMLSLLPDKGIVSRQGNQIILYRTIILTILLCLLTSVAVEASMPQSDLLSHEMSKLLPYDARWHLVVVDNISEKTLISVGNTTKPLLPASLVKLVTSGAVLELESEGKHVELNTEILQEGEIVDGILTGNIVLRGNGNCFLSSEDFRKSARSLQDKGITAVTGNVVPETSRFDVRGLGRSIKGAGHAPVSALGLDLHTVSISVSPAEQGKPPVVIIEPPNAMERFAVSARTVAGGKDTLNVVQIDDSSFKVTGDISLNTTSHHWRFPVTVPSEYAAQSYRSALTQAGIHVHGKAETEVTAISAIALATIPGPTIEQLIAMMNSNSLNVAADNLLLAIGSIDAGLPGTLDKGLKVIQKHLARQGISNEDMRIVDGSGLLPGNRISSNAMAHYLAAVAKRSWFTVLYQSLPRAGIDGTLRSGNFKSERFRAKSGSLENVTSLAGYGVDKAGREIAFSFIVNTPGQLPPNARTAGDSIMQFLADEVLQ